MDQEHVRHARCAALGFDLTGGPLRPVAAVQDGKCDGVGMQPRDDVVLEEADLGVVLFGAGLLARLLRRRPDQARDCR
jgi:hypothetical protein